MSARAVSVAAELTLPGLLERRCAEHRVRTALVAETGERVTYADLLERVRVAARALLHLGVERGARVALWAPNSVEWVVVSLASSFAGAELVPLNTR